MIFGKEKAMKRFGVLLASTALCAALVASGPALAFRGGWGGGHGWGGGAHFAGGGWGHGGWGHGGWGRGGYGYGGWGLAGLGLGLGLAGLDYGYGYPGYGYGYGYPYYGYPGYAYGYGYPGYDYGYPATGATGYYSSAAPLVTGRSVATGHLGNYCSTPATTCELYHASWVGNGCSCRVPGGYARGTVTP
jgi:hypothetical protein